MIPPALAHTTADTIALRPARLGDLSPYAHDPQYKYVNDPQGSLLGRLWEAIIRFLCDALGISENVISQTQWYYIKLGLAGVLLLLVGVWVYRKYRNSSQNAWWVNNPQWDAPMGAKPSDEAATNWEQLLHQALDRQAYRDAVRCQYWTLLNNLAQRQHLRLDPNKTNADYSRELTLLQARAHFDQISRHFAVVWYGHHASTEASYTYMKTLCDQFTNQWLLHES